MMPILFAILPMLPFAIDLHEWSHVVLAVLITPITILALRRTLGHVHEQRVRYLLIAGLVCIGGAILLHDTLGATGETLVTLAGSGLLIGGHTLNWRARNHCTSHHEHDEFE